MTKRIFLLVVLVLLSGCLGTVTSPTPNIDTSGATTVITPNEPDPTPVPLQTVPTELTEVTAGKFAAKYEESRMHNKLVSENSDITRLGTRCDVENVDRIDDSYAVTVSCSHWYEFQTGDAVGIADGAPYNVTHVVSEGGIEQTGNREPTV